MTQSTVVLVHGLWNGGWCWDEVRRHLDAAGVRSVAPDLPMTSLSDDGAIVTEALNSTPGPLLLVGHSYGGAVITAVGAHPRVARLLYLAAFELDETESISRVLPDREFPSTQLGEALVFNDDRSLVSIDPAIGVPLLYDGVKPDEVERSLRHLRPVSRALFSGRPSSAGWRVRPSTYSVCAQDRVVAPELQRAMAERADEVVEWPVGHACLQSHPAEVADLIVRLAAG